MDIRSMRGLAFAALLIFANAVFAAPSFDEKAINEVGWSLTYLGKTYDSASNTTTFGYKMTAQSWEKNLSHWVIELGDAPLTSSACTNEKYGLDPTTGIYGWKCDDGLAAGSTRAYSVTMGGNLGEAKTAYSVKGGTYFAVGETTGPGAPIQNVVTYSVSGFVFVDANRNGQMDIDEPRVANASVMLTEGLLVRSYKTGMDGSYTIANLKPGSYVFGIIFDTPEVPDDVNESLRQYFEPTSSLSRNITVGPNASNQNFGFAVNVANVMGGIVGGTGKTIGFWKHQITSAKAGKTKGIQVADAELKDYLFGGTASIKNLYIDVFSDIPAMTPSAYDYALAILASTSSDSVALLKKQLMGTELNHESGRGLSDAWLQGMLIAWGEFLAKNAGGYSRDSLIEAKNLFDAINNSGE